MGMLTNVWNLQKKQDLQVETRCDWLCPLKDGWEVGYQWRTECFFCKSKGSWDSGPYPNWKVPYISWCFWHHGWLTEGGENLQVPTLLLACLRTVPVAAVSLTCLLYSRSWNEASCTWAKQSLSPEEKMWFTLSCSSSMLSREEGSLSMFSSSWGEYLHTINIEGWMMLSSKYLTSSPFT